MAQITDLNVAPYFDDFDNKANYNRVLFRPGFAVQARELTTLQSILQDQIEQHGNHMFKEGAMVIPGQFSLISGIEFVRLENTFSSETINIDQYLNVSTPTLITGSTSGVSAKVIGVTAASTTENPILHVQYQDSGTNGSDVRFLAGENITSNTSITHTTSYAASVASGQVQTGTGHVSTGFAANVEEGVYYVRGNFVRCAKQRIIIDFSNARANARIGFNISETVETPETETNLLDNATGSSNFAAKGAHRLKITLSLVQLPLGSTNDSSFIQLSEVVNGIQVMEARFTDYSIVGESMARRTFDESGNYTVRPFQFTLSECLDTVIKGKDFAGAFQGKTLTNDGAVPSNDLLTLNISSGKAYIKGFELEKISATFRDIKKSRDFQTVNAGITNFQIGNFAKVTNMFGTPDITFVSGESTAYKTITLFDESISTRGTANGNPVGVARPRSIQFRSGTAGNTDAVFDVFLWDVRPFTKLTLSGTPSPLLTGTHGNGGVKVTGAVSGATGFVFSAHTTANLVFLTNVIGAFTLDEKILASDSQEAGQLVENVGNVDLTISEFTTHKFADARSLVMEDADAGQNFTADLVLEVVKGDVSQLTMNGTDANSTDENDNIVLEADNSTTLALEGRKESKLFDSDKNVSIFKLPKKGIKTLLTASNAGATDSQLTIRRQFIGVTNSSGAISFSAGSNETFLGFAEKDYTLSVLTAGSGGSAAQGQIVSVSGKIAGTGTPSITITDNTLLASAAKVKLTATILKTSVNQRIKTTNLMKSVLVATGATDPYGTRPGDAEISLGRADVFKVAAVFDSESTSADAITPEINLTLIDGSFVRGEKITGSASLARARIIDTSSPMSYVLTDGFGAKDFVVGDIITGQSSKATATVASVTAGSKVITSNYVLDTGQRDNYYDIARIIRKPGVSKPLGKLRIVFDFFGHSGGQFFSVDSYTDVAGQMGYANIPSYTATRVDPDEPEPSGVFPLQDVFDFRPTVENIAGTSTTLATDDEITAKSFDFFHRQFDGTGSSPIDCPKPESLLQADFEFFLGKRASLYMNELGNFNLVEGVASEEPKLPKEHTNAMKLADFIIPAFTFSPQDVGINRYNTQRFTMEDIGRLQKRVENVEYYTALSLLERDAESFEITDQNGLNRFKSGFVVDNFGGHKVGDVQHKDYNIAMDMQLNEARPKAIMRNAGLMESVSSDTARSAVGYQKTGDLITLPYSEVEFAKQQYATRTENLWPHYQASYVGNVTLTPSSDEWFETEVAPPLIINVDGNFDTVLAENKNSIGTVWNAWETQWSGVVGTTISNTNTSDGTVVRSVQTTRTDLSRTGLRTDVIEKIDEESLGSRIISRALIPFVRSRKISFIAECMKPKTRVYPFFDNVAVTNFTTPLEAGFTDTDVVAAGGALLTDGAGTLKGTFEIPDYKFVGQEGVPKFRTGELEFRLTSTEDNKKTGVSTFAVAMYYAMGILNTEQESIVATRNAEVVRTNAKQDTTTISSTTSQAIIRTQSDDNDDNDSGDGTSSDGAEDDTDDDGDDDDPLAQTFVVAQGALGKNGGFCTSVELFFSSKDANLPAWVELRNVVNGFPGPKILPFGRKVLPSNEINVDNVTGASATKFTFPSPVYLQPGTEYCFVARTASLEYNAWISRLGEIDVSGSNRLVSKQPSLGVLFKSQNNRAWSPSVTEDLKFTAYRAKFDINSQGLVTLQNKALDELRLGRNPVTLTNSSAVVQIAHADHGMYSTSNNVTLSNINSGISTTLVTTISAADNTLALTSNTGFPTSGTVFLKIANEILSGTISGTSVTSITRALDSTTATAHTASTVIELYMIAGIPLTQLNKTHTGIANIEMNSYTVTSTASASISGDSDTAEVGGTAVKASENYRYELVKPMVSYMEMEKTNLTTKIRSTTGTSPSGNETPFVTQTSATAESLELNENYEFDSCKVVASQVNETNEMSSNKSVFLDVTITSLTDVLSPVIDTERMSLFTVANQINNIDSSSDVFPTTKYIPMTAPDGDHNACIYITKKVVLENPATAIKVIFSGHKHSSAEIKVLFKTLRTDDASDFDDLSYTFMNSDGSPDTSVDSSADKQDFQEYKYTAGVTDDGIGAPLDSFIQFAIKIVIQGTNAAEPPRLKDFRAIALST